MSRIDGYSSYAQAGGLYDKNPLRKTKTEKSPKSSDKVGEAPKLSERAKKLLEELKAKYKNADFMVAEYDTEEEAQEIMSRGTKEYSVLLDPKTLEQMASDEEVKEKYLGKLEEATRTLQNLKEKFEKEDGNVSASFGISFSEDGTLLLFAQLRKSEEGSKIQKEAKVKAGSLDELLQKIKEYNWEKAQEVQTVPGSKIDVSV